MPQDPLSKRRDPGTQGPTAISHVCMPGQKMLACLTNDAQKLAHPPVVSSRAYADTTEVRPLVDKSKHSSQKMGALHAGCPAPTPFICLPAGGDRQDHQPPPPITITDQSPLCPACVR
uniref:Uncharacterized protein n=1 Tax=Coccidioides posadasii RMSCC 3488 TaxID=454284 RepID=A0A0J6FVF3_COCPO|nr:hypothetical protein CPAG_09719 [Coccidioides posadasii RMSCC 3488]